MPKNKGKRICFVVAPIGEEDSETRKRSDQVLKHIIEPAANECDYKPVRADKLSRPGLITTQIIEHVIEDPLVIADLTERNPNVFYELALRHAIKKPVVQIMDDKESIPFDVEGIRTVRFDHHDLDSVDRAKKEIIRQIRACEESPTEISTPISVAMDLRSLRKSQKPLEKSIETAISILIEMRFAMEKMRAERRQSRQAGRKAIYCPANQSSLEERITFDNAFPSTPNVQLQVEGEPLKYWLKNVSTTGFRVLLEKESGFAGEEVLLHWVAEDIRSS